MGFKNVGANVTYAHTRINQFLLVRNCTIIFT